MFDHTQQNHICHLLLFMSERITCCLRQLFVTWEFSSTVMSLCGPMCLARRPCVLLCYDSSAASDVRCPILCSIRWLFRWLCHGLDYGKAALAGLQASQLRRLQSVLNAASRLIHRSSRYEHVTPMLRDLHWLRCAVSRAH